MHLKIFWRNIYEWKGIKREGKKILRRFEFEVETIAALLI